ncbi:UTP--glucose-1-phosphate uridylyltransferase AglF [Candidatus Burarchaeum australiense]|nr:UTP--glucose-1-phosphate uridylyltransferase AglF [Candidatus Burarchaeum australiense]
MAKVRVSLSLDEGLMKEFDAQHGEGTRSEAIEGLIGRSVGAKRTAVVLAGGPAEGLWSADAHTYRPLIPVKGKPLLAHSLERLREAGFTDIMIVGSHKVNAAIFNEFENGASAGVSLKYVEEKEHNGSAHTLALARPHISGTFLFVPCDHYFTFDLSTVLKFHRRQDNPVTLAVYYGTGFAWTKSSLVMMDGSLITRYWEKPAKSESHLVATMTGFAEPEIFSLLEAKGPLDAQFARLSKLGKLSGCLVSGEFANVHSKKDAASVR